jgi:hypothetical protein
MLGHTATWLTNLSLDVARLLRLFDEFRPAFPRRDDVIIPDESRR